MPQHSYKQLEEAYQRGVNKDHKPNPARTHPMSSRQGKGCQEMPITQTEPAQYSHDSQCRKQEDGWPRKAKGRQHGPARAPGSAQQPTGTVHRT